MIPTDVITSHSGRIYKKYDIVLPIAGIASEQSAEHNFISKPKHVIDICLTWPLDVRTELINKTTVWT